MTTYRYNLADIRAILGSLRTSGRTLDESAAQVLQELTVRLGGGSGPISFPTATATPALPIVRGRNNEKNVPAFQTTKLEQKTGMALILDTVRAQLNKLTDKNEADIFDQLDSIWDTQLAHEKEDELLRVATFVFDIAAANRFYSATFARLYAHMMARHECFRNVLNAQCHTYVSQFDAIEFVDASKDYARYCTANRQSELRKSIAAFFTQLTLQGILSVEQCMSSLIVPLARILHDLKTCATPHNRQKMEDVCECLYILYVPELYEVNTATSATTTKSRRQNASIPPPPLHHPVQYELIDGQYTVYELLAVITAADPKDCPGLTKKALFKLMDIVDKYPRNGTGARQS